MEPLRPATPAGLLSAQAQARLAAAQEGRGAEVRLALASLAPGAVGVVEAEVVAHAAVRTYARKRGGEGLLQRVTLRDASGLCDVVLWDDETLHAKDGPLRVGDRVRMRGPVVKAGAGGAVELGVTGAVLEALPSPSLRPLRGRLIAISPTQPIGEPPAVRFRCELELASAAGIVRAVAWDEAVKQALRAGSGTQVEVQGSPNPFLDGWWLVTAVRPIGLS